MFNSLVITFVRFLHTLLILFVVLVPLQRKKTYWTYFLFHFVICFTLVCHWYRNDDQCFFTQVESKFRDIPLEESFIYSIVNPIYKIEDSDLKTLVSILTPILGLLSFIRLYDNYYILKDQIKDFFTFQLKDQILI
jgi:hypothetical protein